MGNVIKEEKQNALENGVTLYFEGETSNENALSIKTKNLLKEVGKSSGNLDIYITSTARTPYDQARIMYENCSKKNGVKTQKGIYADAGDKVIDVYSTCLESGMTKSETIGEMEKKIRELGPSSVSKHIADYSKLNTFDIAYGRLKDKSAFWDGVKKRKELDEMLLENNCYHIQITQ